VKPPPLPPLPPQAVASRPQALAAVLLQAGGAAAALLSTWLVSRHFGLEAQGRFGLVKGWSDALMTLAMLGLPQALLHLSFQDAGLVPGLLRLAWRFTLGILVLAGLGLLALSWQPAWWWLAGPVLACPAWVLHGQLRALLLRTAGAWVYAVVTVLPALGLLLALAGLVGLGRQDWGAALLASALWSALGAVLLMARAGQPWRGVRAPVPPALWHTNGHALVQNLAAALPVALSLSLLQALGAPDAAVGEVSLSLVFVQVFAALAGFVSPLVYQRVALAPGPRAPQWLIGASLLLLLVPALAWLGMPELLARLLPAGHAGSDSLRHGAAAMVVVGLLMLANRLAATVLQARGAFAELSAQALCRLAATLGLLLLLWRAGLPAVLAAAGAMLVTELLIGGRNLQNMRRRSWPAPQ
jgi:hypothetical protein